MPGIWLSSSALLHLAERIYEAIYVDLHGDTIGNGRSGGTQRTER